MNKIVLRKYQLQKDYQDLKKGETIAVGPCERDELEQSGHIIVNELDDVACGHPENHNNGDPENCAECTAIKLNV